MYIATYECLYGYKLFDNPKRVKSCNQKSDSQSMSKMICSPKGYGFGIQDLDSDGTEIVENIILPNEWSGNAPKCEYIGK